MLGNANHDVEVAGGDVAVTVLAFALEPQCVARVYASWNRHCDLVELFKHPLAFA